MSNSQVSNGQSNITQDTSNMNVGQYNVDILYNGNSTYNSAMGNSLLTVNNPNLINVDCTSTSEWFKAPDSNTFSPSHCTDNLDATGYVCNIPNYFVGPDYHLERNMRMSIVLRTNNNSMMGWGLQSCVNNSIRYWIFASSTNNAKLEELHTGYRESDVNVTNIVSNTDLSVEISIDGDGYITYYDNRGNNKISQSAYTDEELENLYFIFRHWNGSGRIICKELIIEYNINGGE